MRRADFIYPDPRPLPLAVWLLMAATMLVVLW
jgi:hypothetical protein